MLNVLSVCVNFFAISTDDDHIKEPQSISNGPKPNSISGRRTIRAPKKPINMALHLRMPTTSFKKIMASMVAKIGTVNINAVALASSVILNP